MKMEFDDGQTPANVKLVKEFSVGNQTLQVTAKTFKNTRYYDLRLWFPGSNGSLIPTKKGITLRLETLKDVISALCDLAEQEGI